MSFIIASIISSFVAFLIIATQHHHEKFTADKSSGVQKFHTSVTPRIGGLVILAGLIGGIGFEIYVGNLSAELPLGLAIALIPTFLMGMIEDFTKKVTANVRLIAALITGVVFYSILDSAGITRTGLYWMDTYLLSIPVVSLLLTAIIIAGVSNATNLIDGFNGLLLGFSLMATASIAWVSYQVGDTEILTMSMVLIGALFGLMLFNFPHGKLFTGDGGAYMIGFLLVALSILLVNRNANTVSPWFPMLLLLYPITETLFSIIRRIVIDNTSPFEPDDKHLHTLIYRALTKKEGSWVNNNAKTSVFIWPLMLTNILPSLLFFEYTSTLMAVNILFILGYCLIYRRLANYHHMPSFTDNAIITKTKNV